ncbi:hypothetical protein HOU95_gp076 [Streptomyces phage Hiyaa]|uniref:NERD domain-containing protein n=1 Tax=Streptomyces phage Hiyaa TaxID=2499072 RepID=A0A3S9U8T0_9CAUD|nr:hypothetical protein HOU95_gp076 [Streptomyces phage Hiyaa]AZS06731.1 hypothetical protein SEA_HIYAA_92 [Streptomyces phage Hiyaa]
MYRPGSAGYSALRQAVRLWVKHAKDAATWCGCSWAGGGVGFALAPGSLSVVSLVAGGAAGVTLAVWRWRRPSQWRSWLQGARAEYRTGRQLNRLKREGWGVLHDRRIPRSRANLDHVLVHPSGEFLVYVDTKAWHAKKAIVRVNQGRLMYGPWSQAQKVETVAWEASRLQELIGLPTYAVIAVDGGKVNGGTLIFNGVRVTESASLVETLDSFSSRLLPCRDVVDGVTRNIRRDFAVAR